MRRRELLALTASGLAATAGCLAGDDTGDSTDSTQSPAASATPTATPGQGSLVQAVSVDALKPGIIELGNPDSLGVFGEDERQYLALNVVPTAGDAPEPSAFAFMLDGEAYPPVEKTRGIWRPYKPDDEEAEYAPARAGWLLFDLPAPAPDASTTHLT